MKSVAYGDLISVVTSTDSCETLQSHELFAQLTEYISKLINNNFSQLIHLLYRLDISEAKLKQTLKINKCRNAGEIIAEMIIKRQVQKLETRKQFNPHHSSTNNEELW